jgi:hypothetical protein
MLAGAFVQIPALRHVDIYNCQLNGHELQQISQPLRRLSAVTSLAISYLRVEDAAAEVFMSALACMTGLQALKLGVCPPSCTSSASEHVCNLTCLYKYVHVYSSYACLTNVWEGIGSSGDVITCHPAAPLQDAIVFVRRVCEAVLTTSVDHSSG